MNYLIDVVVFAIAAYFIWDLVRAYKAAIGTVWQRSVAAAKGAASSMWTGFTVGVSLAAGGLESLANLLNAPAVSSAIAAYAKPSIVAAVMISTAIIIEWARSRQA